jgi:hypothetical protein
MLSTKAWKERQARGGGDDDDEDEGGGGGKNTKPVRVRVRMPDGGAVQVEFSP